MNPILSGQISISNKTSVDKLGQHLSQTPFSSAFRSVLHHRILISKIVGPKKCWVQKRFWVQKTLGKNNLGPKRFLVKINLRSGSKKIFGQKNVG